MIRVYLADTLTEERLAHGLLLFGRKQWLANRDV